MSLTVYVCQANGCDRFGIGYEVREQDGEPLDVSAVTCPGCQEPRKRVKGSERDDPQALG